MTHLEGPAGSAHPVATAAAMTSTAPSSTVTCPACGAANRVNPERLRRGLHPVCGRCKVALPSSVPLTVTDATFDEEVLASPLPVLLDVWAPWCVPCRGMTPVIDEVASAVAGRMRVTKLNLDQNPAVVARLRIQGIPTLIVFKDGREVDRTIGVRGKEDLLRRLAGVS